MPPVIEECRSKLPPCYLQLKAGSDEFLVRGVRGAITAPANDAGEIINSTKLLLKEMIDANQIRISDIAAVLFSCTADLNQAFPARAARDGMD